MSEDKRKPIFITAGQQGLRLTSADGKKWTDPVEGREGDFYRAAAFGNGIHVCVGTYGGNNIFASTTDGKTWKTDTKDGQYRYYIRNLVFANGQFIGIGGDPGSVGSSSPFLVFSTDGIKWSDYTPIAGKHMIRKLAFGNDIYVGVGDRGRRACSKDARQWTDLPATRAIDTLVDIAYGNKIFAGVGLHGLRMYTADGIKWSPRIEGEEGQHLNSICYTPDGFVAVGDGVTCFSKDAINWKTVANKNAPQTMIHAGELFVGVNWKGRILTSPDAITWTDVHKATQHLDAISFG